MRITREVPACLCSRCWVPRGFWGPVRALLQPPVTAQHAEIRPRRWRASLQQCWLMKMTVEEKRTVMRRFKKKSHVFAWRCRSTEVRYTDRSLMTSVTTAEAATQVRVSPDVQQLITWKEHLEKPEKNMNPVLLLATSACTQAAGEEHKAGELQTCVSNHKLFPFDRNLCCLCSSCASAGSLPPAWSSRGDLSPPTYWFWEQYLTAPWGAAAKHLQLSYLPLGASLANA